MSVKTRASLEAVRTGHIPEEYEPLRIWIGSAFRIAYILELLGTLGFGWSILRTRLLAPWVGLSTIGWSAFWLIGYLAGIGLPGILFVVLAVISVVLLIESREIPYNMNDLAQS